MAAPPPTGPTRPNAGVTLVLPVVIVPLATMSAVLLLYLRDASLLTVILVAAAFLFTVWPLMVFLIVRYVAVQRGTNRGPGTPDDPPSD